MDSTWCNPNPENALTLMTAVGAFRSSGDGWMATVLGGGGTAVRISSSRFMFRFTFS